jgi:hypothetical protein
MKVSNSPAELQTWPVCSAIIERGPTLKWPERRPTIKIRRQSDKSITAAVTETMHKQTILDVIDSLPDEIEVDQLLNQLYVLEKIEAGERALSEQGGVPHAEVEKRFAG